MTFSAQALWLAGLVAVALAYAFLNGLNDSSIILAGEVASRAISRRRAKLLGALAAFAGPLLFGSAVASTVGRGIVDPETITPEALLAAGLSVVAWVLVSALAGIPASSTHALVGSLVGAALVNAGWEAVNIGGVLRVFGFLLLAPAAGLLLSALLTRLILALVAGSGPGVNRFFRAGAGLATLALGMGHSTNDAQKSMGLIALGLLALNAQASFQVPAWAVLATAGAFSLGILAGGRRGMRTLSSLYRIRPLNGFIAALSGALVLFGGAVLGAPLSTGQSVSLAIVGAGAAERMNKVRWHIVNQLMLAWLVTIPGTGLVAGGITLAFRLIR